MNVIVIGPAKTGTTAVSKAIHHALPGSDYRLEPKLTQFFMRAVDPTPGVVVKIIYEHWNDRRHLRNAILHNEMPLKFDRVVATLRDPRDEIVSRMYYVARGSAMNRALPPGAIDAWIELLRRKERDPESLPFLTICDEAKRILGVELRPDPSIAERYHRYLIGTPKRIHILRYEDFVDGKLDALSDHLGVRVAPDPELGEVDYTFRSGGYGEWRRIFTPSDVAELRPRLGPVLDAMGYSDWTLAPEPSLDPSTRSDYVRRLVEDVRARTERATAKPVQSSFVSRYVDEGPALERLERLEAELRKLVGRADVLVDRARVLIARRGGR